jgi:hypothetical protein
MRHSEAALLELQFVKDVKRQPRDLGQLPSQGRFSTASISEYGHSLHDMLQYQAKKLSVQCGERPDVRFGY